MIFVSMSLTPSNRPYSYVSTHWVRIGRRDNLFLLFPTKDDIKIFCYISDVYTQRVLSESYFVTYTLVTGDSFFFSDLGSGILYFREWWIGGSFGKSQIAYMPSKKLVLNYEGIPSASDFSGENWS